MCEIRISHIAHSYFCAFSDVCEGAYNFRTSMETARNNIIANLIILLVNVCVRTFLLHSEDRND